MQKIPFSGGGSTETTDPVKDPAKELRDAADAPGGATGSEILASGGDVAGASKTISAEEKADIGRAMRIATGTMRANAKQGNDPSENVDNIEKVMGQDDGSGGSSTGGSSGGGSSTGGQDPTSETNNKRPDKGTQDSVQKNDESGPMVNIWTESKGGSGPLEQLGPVLLAGGALLVALLEDR
jgi:hypothetical protein